MTPEQRSQRARLAALTRWENCVDRSAATLPARLALMDKFEREVDPNGELLPAVRAKLAESRRKRHYAEMAYKSSRSRTTKTPSQG